MSRQILTTTCLLDCPDSCALDVEVEDQRILTIRGASDGLTSGFICNKVQRMPQRVYHRERILQPMRRTGAKGGNRFEAISWDQATEEIAERLLELRERWGGEAILPYHYGGSNGLLTDGLTDDYFFARLGASQLQKTLCAAPTTAVAKAMYGKMPGTAFADYPLARFILIWGANPKASNIHLVPSLKEAKKRGAFIAVVDPKRNFSRREIDLHLPVLPGADLPLALALIRIWSHSGTLDRGFLAAHAKSLDRLLRAAERWDVECASRASGVQADAILELARRYAESSPAVLRCGWGPERNTNGGQAIAAILSLPALLGKFGVRGGGYTLSNNGAARFDGESEFGPLDWTTRSLNMTRLGRWLSPELSPPLKALFVYNCNPAATVPDQNAVLRGLEREDLFTVVHEQVMTDTARYADLVLPAPTFLEQRDIRVSYGDYKIGGARPVIAPAGESLSNHELFSRLGCALGFSDEIFRLSDEELARRASQALTLNQVPVPAEPLLDGRSVRAEFPSLNPVQFKSVRPATSDGRIDLVPPLLGQKPYVFRAVSEMDYPLMLITPATSKMVNSTFGEFNYPRLELSLNSRDAAERNLTTGDRVRIFNAQGEVCCHLRLDDTLRDGVALLPKGAWTKSSSNGRTSTVLCPDTINEVAGGACFNDARVEVERWVKTTRKSLS